MQGDEGGVRGVLCVSHPAMGSSGERGSGLVLFHSLASWQEAGGGGGGQVAVTRRALDHSREPRGSGRQKRTESSFGVLSRKHVGLWGAST